MESSAPVTQLEAIQNATGATITIMDTIVDGILANPVLVLFVASAVIVLGIGIYRKLRG